MAKSSKKAEDLRTQVHSIWQAREDALTLLKKSAADLDQLLKDGKVKVGDRFTVGDPSVLASGEREIVIVDNFADSNFVWRPLLIERFAIKHLK